MKKRLVLRFLFLVAMIAVCIGFAGGDVLQSGTIDLQVKEPLEIVPQDSNLNLFPGETISFNVTVENHASVSYSVYLSFSLNDTEYQERHVTFSNNTYTVAPGFDILNAWLSVASTAPATDLKLSITINRYSGFKPENDSENNIAPSLTLFAAGVKWAAQNGTSVLYINWYDNYCTHHFSDHPDWVCDLTESDMAQIKNSTVSLLEKQGFTVTCTGDVPNNLSTYDLILLEAYYAIEPQLSELIRNYVASGGNVVVIEGVPCYLVTYCKNIYPDGEGLDLTSIQDWFGSAVYANSGGTANLIVDGPFGTTLSDQSIVYSIETYTWGALASTDDDAKIVACWSDGTVFALAHEYGSGRVYYQSKMNY
jgi:hypothetical protein